MYSLNTWRRLEFYRRKGFAHERDFARRLWSLGFAVIRAPASGSKVKKTIYPDIVAIMNKEVFVFELKTCSREKTIYIPRIQILKMREFLKRSGGRGFIGIKIIGTGVWKIVPIEELEETSSGNYKITIDKLKKSLRLRDLLSIIRKTRSIDEYLNRDRFNQSVSQDP
ncbi:MAG: Holliday junction resolvase Hjc [Desulfurococcaceae archaeon]